MKRWLATILGLLVVLVLAGVFVLPQLIKPQALPPFDQQASWQAASAKLDELKTQLKQGQATVTLSQNEVRAVLSQGIASAAGSEVQGLNVTLGPKELEVQAALTVAGQPLGLTIGGTPEVQGQTLVLQVTRVQVGSVPMPVESALRLISSAATGVGVDPAARTLSLPLSGLTVGGQPVSLNGLQLGNGQVTLDLSSH